MTPYHGAMPYELAPAAEPDVYARRVPARQLARGAGAVLAALVLAYLAYLLHLNLSSVGSLELLLVVIIALRWGLAEATAVSIAAVMVLNLFFIAPIFRLTVADPRNWVSLATFEATALLVSRLSTQARLSAIEAKTQKRTATKLYELSRAILLVDQRRSLEAQLSALIREIIQVERVQLVLTSDTGFLQLAHGASPRTLRQLRIGGAQVGWMTLEGWEDDPLLADAVASLTAIAVERVRAVQRESRADSERDTEKLRTAVLDGLAHGFKTPLTAIRTASSGLLAIGQTDPTQTELLTIIDEQAMLLNIMTTKLLKTASLEKRDVRLQTSTVSMATLVEEVLAMQDRSVQARVHLETEDNMATCVVDAELVKLALTQLIDNAAKYSAVGEPIYVTVQQDNAENRVIVENSGLPLRVEEVERVFERFYRGSNALHGPSGTGIGLSIVKKAADAHQGRVALQVEGPLTRFSFIVPR